MARADSFAKKMPSIPGFEDEATWSGYPGQIQPRGPKSAIASRKDINLGYEHRCTRTGGATPPRPPATLSG